MLAILRHYYFIVIRICLLLYLVHEILFVDRAFYLLNILIFTSLDFFLLLFFLDKREILKFSSLISFFLVIIMRKYIFVYSIDFLLLLFLFIYVIFYYTLLFILFPHLYYHKILIFLFWGFILLMIVLNDIVLVHYNGKEANIYTLVFNNFKLVLTILSFCVMTIVINFLNFKNLREIVQNKRTEIFKGNDKIKYFSLIRFAIFIVLLSIPLKIQNMLFYNRGISYFLPVIFMYLELLIQLIVKIKLERYISFLEKKIIFFILLNFILLIFGIFFSNNFIELAVENAIFSFCFVLISTLIGIIIKKKYIFLLQLLIIFFYFIFFIGFNIHGIGSDLGEYRINIIFLVFVYAIIENIYQTIFKKNKKLKEEVLNYD